MEKKLVNVREMAKIISLPEYTIRKLCREGKIPSYRITGRFLIDPDEAVDAIKQYSA